MSLFKTEKGYDKKRWKEIEKTARKYLDSPNQNK